MKIFLNFLVITIFLCAGLSQLYAQTPEQARAISAAEQLKEFHSLQKNFQKYSKDRVLSSMNSGRVSIRLNAAVPTSSQIYFNDNVEGGLNGWTTQNYTSSATAWHQSSLQYGTPSHSWWHGDEATGTYHSSDRINSAAITPPINLAGAVAPLTLMFAENYFTEIGWDYCMVDVTTDGGLSWTPLRGAYGQAPSGSSGGWTISSLDLSSYAGSNIKIRFYFDTHDSLHNDFSGWFVDDIILFDQGGMITGKKYFDANQNGLKEVEEQGIKEWLITATGPVTISTTTNIRGKYWLPLPLGDYTISEQLLSGWVQTGPPGGTYSVSLATPDTTIDSIRFGNYKPTSFIAGMKFDDVNRNGIKDFGDTALANWKIILADTNGNVIDFDRTDSLGNYSLFVPAIGRYVVKEAYRYGWIQSFPTDDYTVDISDLNTVITGKDFGNYKTDTVQAIIGWKYDDRNRNHIQDAGEVGVENFTIELWRKNSTPNFHYWKKTVTDSTGYYRFASLPPDTYKVKEIGQNGWWQSEPESCYIFALNAFEYKDHVVFGNYEIAPSTISGMKFNDENGNGIKDDGEPGLPNWRINLIGTATSTVLTDADGKYQFTGLWPGTYVVSETWKQGWVQTYPATPGVHVIALGPEESRADVDFGNIDSNYTFSFRTFTSDSLALAADAKGKHVPVKVKPVKVEFSLLFTNHTALPAAKLTMHFTHPAVMTSLTSTPTGAFSALGKSNHVELTFDVPLHVDSSVIIHGFANKATAQKLKMWRWTYETGGLSPKDTSKFWLMNVLRLPMPNAINLLQGVAPGMKVGVGGPHSVVFSRYNDVVNSLVEGKNRIHAGVPRCLDKYSNGSSIKRQVKSLPPKKHNNMLFAEAIALQVNIKSSLQGKTPPGLSGLVYDEGGSMTQLNGMTLIEIAASLDKYMSSYKDTGLVRACGMPVEWTGLSADTLYDRIHKINGAFSGPIDTVSFGSGLVFTGVRELADVPFLRYDAAAAARIAQMMENFSSYAATDVPDRFTLYQNYPNPFNPTTQIDFYLTEPSIVTLKIYNILGQEVATLANREDMEDGMQTLEFNASSLSSGVYFYRIIAEGQSEEGSATQTYTGINKMVLIK
jgi:hypothetical protein